MNTWSIVATQASPRLAALLKGALACALSSALLPTSAAEAPSLELSALRLVPATATVAEHLVQADTARIGDVLAYVARYRNPTAATLHHVIVDVPVPTSGAQYVLESATPRPDAASADGKRFAALPLMRTEVSSDGRRSVKPAPAADYRVLRWDLGDVAPATTREVTARVKVIAAPSADR